MSIRSLIHAADPYAGLNADGYVPDLQGWGSHHPAFRSLITELRPRRILEVGTWKGGSALHMADIVRELNLTDCEICCVDTWLGALEFWINHDDPERYKSLKLVNGYPSVYYTFLKNVVATDAASLITPFPVTSAIAARFFAHHNITFDLVYIDGSHDYEDVSIDIESYWPLVAPLGALLGDDYNWGGVKRAADEFAIKHRLSAAFLNEKWVFRRALLENWLSTSEVGIRRSGQSFEAFSRADFGYGFAAWRMPSDSIVELDFDRLAVPPTPYGRDHNAFFGVIVDFPLPGGTFNRIGLCASALQAGQRQIAVPSWGKGAIPDRYIPIEVAARNVIDLAQYRPADCDGPAIVSFGIQNVGPGFEAAGTLRPRGAAAGVSRPAGTTLASSLPASLSRRARLL